MLAYLFLCKVATLTQSIFTLSHSSICAFRSHKNLGVAVFAGIAVFARHSRLNIIIVYRPGYIHPGIVGERSEPSVGRWMDSYCRIYVCRTFITRQSTEDLRTRLKMERVVLETKQWSLD